MRRVLCVCSIVPELNLSTRVTVLMHWREVTKTTNTGKLASLVLPNSEVRVRGDRNRPMSSEGLVSDDYQSVILFPTADSRELTPDLVAELTSRGRPLHLIVTDGNWRQARKVTTRVNVLRDAPRVRLSLGARSEYQLRHSPHQEKLSTFEAIARALGVIEGPDIQAQMESLFAVTIERILWSRGKRPLAECQFPIPEAAIQAFFDDGRRGTPRKAAPQNEVEPQIAE